MEPKGAPRPAPPHRADDDNGMTLAPPAVPRESLVPVVVTVLAAMALPLLLPEKLSLGPKGLVSVLAGVLLVATALSDPDRTSRRSAVGRLIAIVLLVVLTLEASWSTVRLLIDLVQGGPETNNATALLVTGALVWTGNNIVFALMYWELDSGGAAARARHAHRYPDLAFPGHANPTLVPPGWRPVYVDYLYLGLTNALAFSPTDVMPLAHWAKLAMALQSLISVVILSLIIARAVNILT